MSAAAHNEAGPLVTLLDIPWSRDAEMSTLGSCLISKSAIDRMRLIVLRDDFYLEKHRFIFDAIEKLASADKPVDLLSATEELTARKQLDDVGGVPYLMTLAECVPTAAHVEYYARIVADKATLRRLIDAGGELRKLGLEPGDAEVDALCDAAEQCVYAVRRKARGGQFFSTGALGGEMWEHYLSSNAGGVEIPTGLRGLDYHLNGWQRSDFIIIAGDSGMGKTQFLCHSALAAGKAEVPTAIFSLEMPKEQIYSRLVAMLSGVDSHLLIRGGLPERELERVGRAVGQLGNLPIEINDARDGKGILEIRSQAREWMRGKDRAVIFIDHFQCIDPPPRVENATQIGTRNAKGCKSMARELLTPVICLSQVSRETNRREDHRPRKGDIRDSQMIVAECDVILGLYRKGYYELREASEADPGSAQEAWPAEAEIIGLKHRNGPEFSRRVWFDGPTGRYLESHPGFTNADAPPDREDYRR